MRKVFFSSMLNLFVRFIITFLRLFLFRHLVIPQCKKNKKSRNTKSIARFFQ